MMRAARSAGQCSRLQIIFLAMDDIIREGEKRGTKFSAEMTHAHSCNLCGSTKKWKRVAEGDQRLIAESPT
jgi:hypothetical protein